MNIADERPPDRPAFQRLSRVEPIGSGGMGTVFRAWQDDLGRAVAVKTLRADLRGDAHLRELFTHEARVLARLDDPGIVPVYYAGDDGGGPYYVMRLVDGVAVDRFLAGKPALAIAAVFREVAMALAKVHREGVLHRDIKPDNILVEASGRPVLVDFGLSTIARPGAPDQDENPVGTLDFLAPELLGGAPASVSSDVYALGATIYVALTGRVPFAQKGLQEKLYAIREEDPPLPRTVRADVPKPLQAICLKAMERAPETRYASADELARDLARFGNGDVVLALPVRSRAMLRRKAERHFSDHADWLEQGLIDERERADLEHAYERVLEHEQGLLRGVFASVPNLLLFAGIVLSVFGPAFLQMLAWSQQGLFVRIALPAVPLSLLAGVGFFRWRLHDRRRGVACLLGAALLCAPLAFALADLAAPLRYVLDDAGAPHPILPGGEWEQPASAPAWMHALAHRLHWKLLIAVAAALASAMLLFLRTRAAAFVWVAGIAGSGALLCLAPIAGWSSFPLLVRWILVGAVALATLAAGAHVDRRFQRERAQPFYGLGFLAIVVAALAYSSDGVPLVFFGCQDTGRTVAWSHVLHGLAFTMAGVAVHLRGASSPRAASAAPLLIGFLMSVIGLAVLGVDGSLWNEVLLVTGCIAFLCLGLALHRGSLVLLSAIALPMSIGSVSQRHVDAVWAWSLAIVVGGALLVLVSFRLAAKRARP